MPLTETPAPTTPTSAPSSETTAPPTETPAPITETTAPPTAPTPTAPTPTAPPTETASPPPIIRPEVQVPGSAQPAIAGADAWVPIVLSSPGGDGAETAESTATVTAPAGLTLRALTVRLLPATADATPADTAGALLAATDSSADGSANIGTVNCDDPTVCTVVVPAVPARGRVVIDVHVTVATDVPTDVALAVAVGDGAPVRIPVTVTSGMTGVRLEGPSEIVAGTAAAFRLTADVHPGVTAPGALILVSDREGVTFTAVPDGCVADASQRLICSTGVVDVQVAVGAAEPTGPLAIRVLDAAGRSIPLVCDSHPMVSPAAVAGGPAEGAS